MPVLILTARALAFECRILILDEATAIGRSIGSDWTKSKAFAWGEATVPSVSVRPGATLLTRMWSFANCCDIAFARLISAALTAL